ncbi:MAG TPA: calcium-binding protein, partial [Sphingomicrobium sp.]|nr:calcium-binding protein [Sphingomicrobium sp.]
MANILGTDGDDQLQGTTENDTIEGGAGNDSLEGGDGNDLLDGGSGDDYMAGGAGDDVYVVDGADGVWEAPGEGTDEVRSYVDFGLPEDFENLTALGDGNIYLGGNGLDNTITGNAGDNYMRGEGGSDTLDGGDGWDISANGLPYGTIGSLRVVDGPDGTLLVQLVQDDGSFEDVFSVTINGPGSATVTGLGMMAGSGTDTVTNIEDLHFFVDSDPTPDNQFVNIQLSAWVPQSPDFLHVSGSAGADVIDLAALYPDVPPDTPINAGGGRGDDAIYGNDGGNYIGGDQGNDVIDGRDGDDTLAGGQGDDSLSGGIGNDYIDGEGGNDSIDGGDGSDIAAFRLPAGTTGSLRVVDGPDGTLLVQLVQEDWSFEDVFAVSPGVQGGATVTGLGMMADFGTDVVANVEDLHFFVDGTTGDQFVNVPLVPYVPQSPDFLHVAGSVTADTIDLAELYPEVSTDTPVNANGGLGDDQIYGNEGGNYIEGNEDNDTIDGRGGDDAIIGGDGNDNLAGGAGNDYLEGGSGDDFMAGGAGDDVYLAGAGDGIVENADEGTDEVRADVDWGLGDNIENLTAIEGSGAFYLGGNSLDNVITGNSADNYMYGGGGNDTLDGGDGRDVAAFHLPHGTTGSMRMVDGPNGTILVQLVQDNGSFEDVFSIAIAGSGSATVTGLGIAAGEGTDTVVSVEELHFFVDTYPDDTPDNQFVFVSLSAYVPPLEDNFAHVSGSDGGDFIDLAALYPDAGPDANINSNGGAGDDTILGTEGWNYLRGDAGNDTIDGRGGGDSVAFGLPAGMTGTLRVVQGIGDQTGSLVVERVDGETVEQLFIVSFAEDGTTTVQGINSAAFLGTDTVSNAGALDFVVDNPEFDPNQFVNIILPVAGTDGPEAIYGSDQSDLITGAGAGDSLYGFAGDDILLAGAGNDFLRGGDGNDIVDGGDGHDRASFFDSLVGVQVDLNLQGQAQDTGQGMDTLVGIESVSGTVNDDILIGDDGANSLWGSGGNDTLSGNGGDDYLGVSDGDHLLDGGDGSDSIAFVNEPLDASGPVTVDLNLTDAQWTGIGTWTISNVENVGGGDFNDVLTGNAEANILAGGVGNDRLTGGAGNDLLLGDGY